MKPRVSILGGGFAGLACANALDSQEFEVSLFDRKTHFEFLPNIHELVSGVKKPSQLRLGLREAMLALGHRYVKADVSRVEPESGSIFLGKKEVEADYLVIALGSAEADYGVPGVAANSLGFKSASQCQAIGKRLKMLARELEQPRIVIVGGGLEGLEALGEVLRRYPEQALHLTIIEAQSRLLPEGPVGVSKHLSAHCHRQGVQCVTGDPVAKISPKSVLLKSGRRLRSDATIWTGGPTPPALLQQAGLATAAQWAPVDRYLAHATFPKVFIAGDAAQLPTPLRKQAYHALDMGRCAAENITRRHLGKRLRRFRASPKPTLLAFGDIDTVMITTRGSLAGPPLAAGKEAVFAAVMAQLDQRDNQERLQAVTERAKAAGRELLWPTLTSWEKLRGQARLKKLP